ASRRRCTAAMDLLRDERWDRRGARHDSSLGWQCVVGVSEFDEQRFVRGLGGKREFRVGGRGGGDDRPLERIVMVGGREPFYGRAARGVGFQRQRRLGGRRRRIWKWCRPPLGWRSLDTATAPDAYGLARGLG